MLRLRAVRALLVEDVAGLRRAPEREPPLAGAEDLESAEDPRLRESRELTRARRRALAVSLLCAGALAALFVLRDPTRPWLAPGRNEEGAFTVGVLLVAAYAGFRLAQYLHLRTVSRLHAELLDRDP